MMGVEKVQPEGVGREFGSGISAESYLFLQQLIRRETGIIIEDDREYLLRSRLMPILSSETAIKLKIDSIDGLIQCLAAGRSDALKQLVLDGATTNETFFFRDEPVFEALRTEILPALLQAVGGKRKLRIWSAASSTGQEAYSVALLLKEMGKSDSEVEIVGTDISWHALERARQASYLQFEVGRGLPLTYLKRYFHRNGNEWQLQDEVRSMVRFEQADLRRDLRRLGRFDLVLCRNVLIYFDVETKKQILVSLEPMLHYGGLLALGCAETVINLFDRVQRKTCGKATFYSFS